MSSSYLSRVWLAMLATCCSVTAACGSSEDASSSNGAGQGSSPSQERATRLPEPSGPVLKERFGGRFPVEIQMVGIESSPTIGEDPAPPGKTTLGVLMQVRGKLTDRPTPRDHPTAVKVRLPIAEDQCTKVPGGELARGHCSSTTQEQTNYVPKRQAQAAGLGQFTPLTDPTEWKDEDLPAGVPQYIELFYPGMNKRFLQDKSTKLCNDHDQCIDLAAVPKLPAR